MTIHVPKQIIYPLNYARLPWLEGAADGAQRRFLASLSGVLGSGCRACPLGRARIGIYLLVKWALEAHGRRDFRQVGQNQPSQGQRNKVILSAYTIPDVIRMVTLAGGQPVFIDLAPKSTNIDVELLGQLLDDRVACVLITHYHVNQASFAAIVQLCASREVALFEDCAIALGGTLARGPVGTLSDGAILSLSGYKFLNYFWGGVVFSRHASLMDWVEEETREWRRLSLADYLPQLGRVLKYDLAMSWPLFDWLVFPLLQRRQRSSAEAVSVIPPRLESEGLDPTLTSLPSRSAFQEWQAKFPRLAGDLAHRRRVAGIYDRYLGTAMVAAETDPGTRAGSCYVNYPVYVGEERRNGLFKALIAGGFDVGASLYPNCGDHDKFSGVPGATARTRDLVRAVISLPTHPRVEPAYAEALGRRLADLL